MGENLPESLTQDFQQIDAATGIQTTIVSNETPLAVVQAVKETTGVALNIKWPNDIYLRTAAETEQNINLTNRYVVCMQLKIKQFGQAILGK